MFKENHRLFGEIVADRFNLPKEGFVEWTIIPDMQYYKKSRLGNMVLHRFTSHGFRNIDVCIDQGKLHDSLIYKEEYDMYIRCLLMSHFYLDVFNWIIHPSYPRSWEFKFIWSQLPKILTFRTINDLDMNDVFKEIIYSHDSIESLYITMIHEYTRLPRATGNIKKILEKY